MNGTRNPGPSGANGGVGTAAVQVARALGGRVTALASAPHLDRLRDLGAEQAFDYHVTAPRGLGQFDVIVDPAGYVDDKSVTPVIDSVYPLDDIAAAHRSLEQSGGFGKRVIQVA